MTRYLAVTTCNAEQWRQYGLKMAQTFVRYWPSAVSLRLYAEGDNPDRELAIDAVNLEEAAPWLEPWKSARTKAQRGKIDGRYNYRFDAVKFAHKVAAIGAAAEGDDCDVLIWIDADTITHSQVTVEWLDALLPLSATMGWLGRDVKYPECGYLMFRLPASRQLIWDLVSLYQSGELFKLAEWHDSFAIWHCVKAAMRRGDVVLHSFSDLNLPKRHPFINSSISTKLDHLKGNRKQLGRSPKHERIIKDDVEYWK